MKHVVSVVVLAATVAHAQSVAYISSEDEPFGQNGNVESLNDVYGDGDWKRTYFSAPADTFGHDVVIMDGGNGATLEFEGFVDANRDLIEDFVNAGGVLIIGAARWNDQDDFDFGFGITLHAGADDTGTAVDDSHPVFDGPFGATGAAFYGESLAHNTASGKSLQPLMMGDGTGLPILGEMPFGNGFVIAHGLSLPFFGVHDLWSDNSGTFLRNLHAYAGTLASGCPADVNGDGVLNVLDFVAFQGFWQNQNAAADCDNNGVYNILDFVCFQQLFVQGCG